MMNQEKMEQGWQQFPPLTDMVFGQLLRNNLPAIEYKANAIALLQLPPDYKFEDAESVL